MSSSANEGTRPGLARTIEIHRTLERRELGAFRRRVILICWLIAVLDGFDVQAMAFVAPTLAKSWAIDPALMGQVLTAGLVGLMLGSVVLGRLSDRMGRRPVLLFSIALFGAGSLLTCLSESPLHLMLMRCVTGVGLGGAIVTALALVAEYSPPRLRATMVTAMFVGFPLGGSIGGLLATPLITHFEWQSVFLLGGLLPLLLLAGIWRYLPESLKFSVARNAESGRIAAIVTKIDPQYHYQPGDRFVIDEDPNASSSIAQLFVPARLRGTLLIWLTCFANLLVLYLLINWLPSILHQGGLSISRANMGAVIFNLGGICGGLALSLAVDRLGAFRVLGIGYALTAMIVLLLARAQTMPLALALTLTVMAGAGIMGAQFCFNALIASYYPTTMRSTGVGWALGVGRIGSMLGPLVGGIAVASGATVGTIFSFAAVPMLICSIAVALLSTVYAESAR